MMFEVNELELTDLEVQYEWPAHCPLKPIKHQKLKSNDFEIHCKWEITK